MQKTKFREIRISEVINQLEYYMTTFGNDRVDGILVDEDDTDDIVFQFTTSMLDGASTINIRNIKESGRSIL